MRTNVGVDYRVEDEWEVNWHIIELGGQWRTVIDEILDAVTGEEVDMVYVPDETIKDIHAQLKAQLKDGVKPPENPFKDGQKAERPHAVIHDKVVRFSGLDFLDED